MNAQQLTQTFLIAAALNPSLQSDVETAIATTELSDVQKAALVALFRGNAQQIKVALNRASRNTRDTLSRLARENFSNEPLFAGAVDDLSTQERVAIFATLGAIVSQSAKSAGAMLAQLPDAPDVSEALAEFQEAADV